MKKSLLLIIALIGIMMLFTGEVNAQALATGNVLDDIVLLFFDTAKKWGAIVQKHAERLFYLLTLCSAAWSFMTLPFKIDSFSEFIQKILFEIMFIGFFYVLLTKGSQWTLDIVQSLFKVGQEASNLQGLNPSKLVDIGLNILFGVAKKTSFFSPVDSVVMIIVALGILLLLTKIACDMMMLMASLWFMAYGGFFVLGFGGSRWTSHIAVNYITHCISVGMAMFGMTLVVGTGYTFIDQLFAKMNGDLKLTDMAVFLVATFMLFQLSQKIPGLFSGLISGGISGQTSNVTAGGIASTSAIAIGGTVAAGYAIKMGAMNAAGGLSALNQAAKSARSSSSGTPLGNKSQSNSSSEKGSNNSTPLATASGDKQSQSMNSISGSSGSSSKNSLSSGDSGQSSRGASDSGSNNSSNGNSGASEQASNSKNEQSESGNQSSSGSQQQTATTSSSGSAKTAKKDTNTSGITQTIVNTGKNLAKGTFSIAKKAANEKLDAVKHDISQTTGGKIASAIKETREKNEDRNEPKE